MSNLCLFVYPIITTEPCLKFDLGTCEHLGNVLVVWIWDSELSIDGLL